jgi:hypothetical protein
VRFCACQIASLMWDESLDPCEAWTSPLYIHCVTDSRTQRKDYKVKSADIFFLTRLNFDLPFDPAKMPKPILSKRSRLGERSMEELLEEIEEREGRFEEPLLRRFESFVSSKFTRQNQGNLRLT